MFTGLVEAMGVLVRRTDRGRDARLVIRGDLAARRDPVVLGESIAIDGVCLTVDAILEQPAEGPVLFEVDASSETLAKTTLGALPLGGAVNLERALPLGGRLGGHIVSGHVDGVGRVVETRTSGTALEVVFEAPAELGRFIAEKGSICVNGVSLTVNGVAGGVGSAPCRFDVMLVPHTREKTSLDRLATNARVNLEVDILARYVARLVATAGGPTDGDTRLLELLRGAGYA